VLPPSLRPIPATELSACEASQLRQYFCIPEPSHLLRASLARMMSVVINTHRTVEVY